MMRRPTTEMLSRLASGRDSDPFATDMAARRGELMAGVRGRRILVIGGAGSIGSATARVLLGWQPAALHVLDHDENGLAEFIRDVRSRDLANEACDLRALPLDYGALATQHLLACEGPYDLVLNFAAMKHVRSEKDRYSLAQMIDTNVLRHARLLGSLRHFSAARRYFYISTDKAANPVNAMGATKRLGELLARSGSLGPGAPVSAARFANVAYSSGSLLSSFLSRIDRGQPIAVPEDAWRFFVSLDEAAHICVLSALLAPEGTVMVPSEHSDFRPRLLEDVAKEFLRAHQLDARVYRDPAEARAAVRRDVDIGQYPVLLTPLDTSGEKSVEEFVATDECAVASGLTSLDGILLPDIGAPQLVACLEGLEHAVGHSGAGTEVFLNRLASAVPTFRHRASEHHLDGRM